MTAKKEVDKKAARNPTNLAQNHQNQQQSPSFNSQSSLSISRNKHWKYISSYHGPWLQLPLELLESLYVINTDNVATPPPPIDPIIFGNLISIRRLVDEAADLSVRAASGISTSGGSMRNTMSHTRQHRMRELAVNKLALAYRIDEIATAVVTMQSASAIDEVASRVLKKNATNLEAMYVNFFHEKIPSSRMLSQSTSTEVLDQIIATSPNTPEFYRTRGVVKCFKEEFSGALRDFKTALAHVKHKKRVNSVLLGKKVTTSLHHHHGKDADECTGTESQLYFLRAACYLQYAVSMIDKAIQKVDGVDRRDGEGSDLRLVSAKGTGHVAPSSTSQIPKIEQYRQEFLPIMHQVQNMARRSIRDYTHFLGFYPSSLPPFTVTNDETTSSKASSPTASRDPSPVRGFKDRDENVALLAEPENVDTSTQSSDLACKHDIKSAALTHSNGTTLSGVGTITTSKDHIQPSQNNHNGHNHHHHHHHHHHHFHGFQPPHSFATYHPLLIEAWYAIALNYILLGDIHTASLWHARIADMHECIEGYPVFLPARSMAQADYMEVLERVKKATSLVQHEKLKELIDVVKQKEREREEKEREWLEKHHHHKMLLAAAEEEKEREREREFTAGKKYSGKTNRKSKDLGSSLLNGRNGGNNSIAPVVGIDGQKHHPCCPLAPGNHTSVNKDSSPSNSSVSSNSSSNNSNGTGPRQYPLHTQRADSVMLWLRAVILRQDKETLIANGVSVSKIGRKAVDTSP